MLEHGKADAIPESPVFATYLTLNAPLRRIWVAMS